VARALSTVVPGLGEVYAGARKGGLNALALSAATGYLVVDDVVDGRIREAVIDGLLLFSRFYSGNRERAAAAATRRNQALGRTVAAQILQALEQP